MNRLSAEMWLCPNCQEAIEAHFQLCWNCGSDDEGNIQPGFVNDSEPLPAPAKPKPSLAIRLAWMVLAICIFGGIMAGAIAFEQSMPAAWDQRASLVLGLCLFGLLAAVAINIASRLYVWLQDYLEPASTEVILKEVQERVPEDSLVQLSGQAKRESHDESK